MTAEQRQPPPLDRTPEAEIGKRVAEAGAGLAAAAKAVALEDHRRMLADHAQRVRDSHRWQMEAAGGKPAASEEDMAGNIIVTGDVYGNKVLRGLVGAAETPAAPATKPVATAAKSVAPWIVAAGLLAGGGIGSAVTAYLRPPAEPPAVTAPAAETQQPAFPLYDVKKWVPK